MSIESTYLDNVYVYVDSGIIRKYSNPYVYGDELSRIVRNAAYNILRNEDLDDRVLVVKILEGGRYYYISETLKRLGIRDFEEAEINIKSRLRYDESDVVTKVIEYGDVLEKLNNRKIMILGETIASGSTMQTFLNVIGGSLRNLDKIVILGFHTYVGIERTIKILRKYGTKYVFYSYGSLLGLGPNKTDMTIGYSPSYVPDNLRKRVYEKLGKYLADHLCVIGDFTYSFKYLPKYLAERVIQIRELFDEAPHSERKFMLSLIREGLVRMMQMGLSTPSIEALLSEEYKRRMKLIGVEVERNIRLEDVLNDNMFD